MTRRIQQLKSEFVEFLRSGAKPREAWRVGVEIEVFGFDSRTKERLDNFQVQMVLRELSESDGDLIFENDLLIQTETASGKWTIEPGGQIEFSSAARMSLCEIERDLRENFDRLKSIGERLNFQFLALGFDPLRSIDEQKWFLGEGYRRMKPFMRERGRRSWDMMTRTCAIQVNLDYGTEADLVKKFVVGNRLAPIVAAIFANSPFADGGFNNYQSNRVLTWLETDAARSGVSPLALKDDFSLNEFVEYALNIQILLLRKNGEYVDAFTGKSFRTFLESGDFAQDVYDFQNHLNKIFTEARLKNYIELRSADGGNPAHALAVGALWKGLFYDDTSLDAAFQIAPKLNAEEFCALQKDVARNGLRAVSRGKRVLDVAKETVEIAVSGLQKTAPDEVRFLNLLRERILIAEKSPADILLENWCGSIEKVFELTAI